MKMKKPYYYKKNGERVEVGSTELCKYAESLGYEPDYGIYRTSQAAGFLRDRGYEVGENKKV